MIDEGQRPAAVAIVGSITGTSKYYVVIARLAPSGLGPPVPCDASGRRHSLFVEMRSPHSRDLFHVNNVVLDRFDIYCVGTQ